MTNKSSEAPQTRRPVSFLLTLTLAFVSTASLICLVPFGSTL
jgi:hypothetical protein